MVTSYRQSSGIGCNNTLTSGSLIASPIAIRFDPHDTVIRYQVRTNVSKTVRIVDYHGKLMVNITPYLSCPRYQFLIKIYVLLYPYYSEELLVFVCDDFVVLCYLVVTMVMIVKICQP